MRIFKKALVWYWLFATAAFLFQVLFIYRHFYYYHADTGWELYSIWAATKGHGNTDFLMSWRAGYLFNVPFMMLGFTLYALRILFLCTWLFAISLFVWGLDKKLVKNEVLPIALFFGSLCPSLISDFIVDYYTAPPLFLALSLGLLFVGMRKNRVCGTILLSLSALSLALASLSNIGVLPAGILSAILIGLYYRNKKAAFFTLFYFISLGFLAYAYFYSLGVQAVYDSNFFLGGHAKVAGGWQILFFSQIMGGLATLICILFSLSCAIFIYLPFYAKESSQNRLVLIYIIIGLLADSTLIFFCLNPVYLFFSNLFYCSFMVSLTYLFFYKADNANKNLIIFTLLLITLIYLANRATSISVFDGIIPQYSGLLFGSLLPLILPVKNRFYKHTCFIILMAGILSFSLFANFSSSIPNNNADILNTTKYAPMLGIKVDPQSDQFLQTMQKTYDANDCQDKTFFAFYDTPIAYYYFKRLAPFNQSWVQDIFYSEDFKLNNNSVIQMLEGSQHWCVVYSPLGAIDKQFDHNDILKGAHQYLIQNAKKAIPLGYEPNWGKTYTMYVK